MGLHIIRSAHFHGKIVRCPLFVLSWSFVVYETPPDAMEVPQEGVHTKCETPVIIKKIVIIQPIPRPRRF